MCLQPQHAWAESPKHSQMATASIQCYSLLLNPISLHPPQSLQLVDSLLHSGLSDSVQHNCQIASVLWRQRSLLNQLNRCQNTGRRNSLNLTKKTRQGPCSSLCPISDFQKPSLSRLRRLS